MQTVLTTKTNNTENNMNYLPQESHLIPQLRTPLIKNPKIEKSNSSYGNYVIKLSNATFQFFWNKKQAQDYLVKHLELIK